MSRLDRQCGVVDCECRVWSREMCRKHYMRWHQHGDASVVLRPQPARGSHTAFIGALRAAGEGCVRWPFATNNNGYAQVNTKAGKRLVSRLVCERFNGPPPSATHQAAHSCGKGHEACVAPWHLSWKTVAANMSDMVAHGTRLRGDAAPWAKLSEADARAILALKGSRGQSKIADRYGVTQAMVSRIWLGKAWAHLQGGAQAA